MVFALFAAIGWGTGPVFTRLSLQHIRVTSVAVVSLTVGVTLFLILALALHWSEVLALSPSLYLAFFFIGLFNNTLGIVFFTNSIKLVGASRASTIASTQPLFASILAIIFLGESLTPALALGTLAIVGGVVLIVSDRAS